ncbi:DHH family phosphoesterase [Caniella muris]|uniref:DHH family phosphoesterase n=1 Tax=Caniella muris TaxID=2941502 RepID=UPI002040434B|nr:DHH family phosphoesterase [Caniella muris]
MVQSKLFRSLCERRGWTDEFLGSLDAYEEAPILGLDRCAERVARAVASRERICLFCDFDTDGLSSLMVLTASLSAMGADVGIYLPDPASGYGISRSQVAELLELHPTTGLILTADVGISADDAWEYAHGRGVEVVVTDHHQKDSEVRSADAWADPALPEDPYPHTVCGAEVASRLMGEVAALLQVDAAVAWKVDAARAIAGLGARGDMMPALGPSRASVRRAVDLMHLICLSDGSMLTDGGMWGAVMLGLRALVRRNLEYANDGTPKRSADPVDRVDEHFLDMRVSPQLNSIRRTGSGLDCFWALMTAPTEEARSEAAGELVALNERRKAAVEEAMEALLASEQPLAPWVLCDTSGLVRPSFAGLVANRLMEATGSPCLVLVDAGDGVWSGSGRCPMGANLRGRLVAAGIAAAGHGPAFGVSVAEGSLELAASVLRAADGELREIAGAVGPASAVDWLVAPGRAADTVVGDDYLFEVQGYLRALSRVAPFGPGLARPQGALFFLAGEEAEVRTMGRDKDHVKWVFEGVEAIGWRAAGALAEIGPGTPVCVVGEASVNTFLGRRGAQVTGDTVLTGDDALAVARSFSLEP